jgi:hypothetical protein
MKILSFSKFLLLLLKRIFMGDAYHIRVKKEYAAKLIELLRTDDAIEDLELKQFELSENQKAALDEELDRVAKDTDHLHEWESVKSRYKLV